MKLKPCPFCGGEPELSSSIKYCTEGCEMATVNCDCGAEIMEYIEFKRDRRWSYFTLEKKMKLHGQKVNREVVKKWNKRV